MHLEIILLSAYLCFHNIYVYTCNAPGMSAFHNFLVNERQSQFVKIGLKKNSHWITATG